MSTPIFVIAFLRLIKNLAGATRLDWRLNVGLNNSESCMVCTWRSGEREKRVLDEGVYEKRMEITRACLELKLFVFRWQTSIQSEKDGCLEHLKT